jgi:hypothetical protein
MTAEVVTTQTDEGWDVHITDAEDVVVRTMGKRITVAIIPDDDDTLPVAQPLDVTLGDATTSA